MRIFRTLLVLMLLCAPAAWAQNTIINNGDSGLSARNKLNSLIGLYFNVAQPPYVGLVTTGGSPFATDWQPAIQAAVNDACAVGGQVLFPIGTYTINSSITFPGCFHVALVGAGVTEEGGGASSLIICNQIGFCVDKPDCIPDPTTPQPHCAVAGSSVTRVSRIEHLGIRNQSTDLSSGALRWEFVSDAYINDCYLQGMIALEAMYDLFVGQVNNCNMTSSGPSGQPGSIGVAAGQIAVYNSKIGGFETGYMVRSVGFGLYNGSVETSNIGIRLGVSMPDVFVAKIDNGSGGAGTTLTVTNYVAGSFLYNQCGGSCGLRISSNITNCATCTAFTSISAMSQLATLGGLTGGSGYVNGTYTNVILGGAVTADGRATGATANITVSGGAVTSVTPVLGGNFYTVGDVLFAPCTSLGGAGGCLGSGFFISVASLVTNGKGGNGTYTVNNSQLVASQSMRAGPYGDPSSAVTIKSFQTEAVNTGLIVDSSSTTNVDSMGITGSHGVGIQATTATWSAAAGGTIVYTLSYDSGRHGTFNCEAESFNPTGYNTPGSPPAMVGGCVWASVSQGDAGNTVTRTGTGGNPGAIISPGIVDPMQDYCLRIGGGSYSSYSNITCSVSVVGNDVDLLYGGFSGGDRVVFNQLKVANGITPSSAGNRAGWVINNSNVSEAALNIHFRDLRPFPGVANPSTLVEGEEHLIVDGTGASCGDGTCTTFGTTVTDGTTTTGLHLRVRWNGSNWTLVGR